MHRCLSVVWHFWGAILLQYCYSIAAVPTPLLPQYCYSIGPVLTPVLTPLLTPVLAPVLAQYWPSTGPVLAPVLAQYWPSTDPSTGPVLAQYWPSTDPVLAPLLKTTLTHHPGPALADQGHGDGERGGTLLAVPYTGPCISASLWCGMFFGAMLLQYCYRTAVLLRPLLRQYCYTTDPVLTKY